MFKDRRDEREIEVEKTGYSIAFQVLTYAILGDVMYRSFFLRESSMDLLLIVVGAGAISTIYQARHQAWTRGSTKASIIAFAFSLIVALTIALVNNFLK